MCIRDSHGTLDDAEVFVQNLGERRQAVGGARGVGDDVGRRVELVRVDANDVGRDVVTLGRGSDNNLLGTSSDVLASARAVEEDTGTFDDDVDAHFLPRQLQRVSFRDNVDDVTIDRHGLVIDNLDVSLERTQDGIVLEQVRSRLGAAGLVDADDLERAVRSASLPASDKVTADAAETVDRNLDLVRGDNGVVDGSLRVVIDTMMKDGSVSCHIFF